MLAAIEGYRLDFELLAGDPASAVAAGEESCRLHEELGGHPALSTVAGKLARAYCELGQLPKAERWAVRSADLGANDDALTQDALATGAGEGAGAPRRARGG